MNPASNLMSDFGGELAALGAAFLWAAASVLYRRIGRYLSPSKLNFIKNIIVMAMILVVLMPAGERILSGIDSFAVMGESVSL